MAKSTSFSNLSHKSLSLSTPVLTSNPLTSSKSFSTPPLSASPRLNRRGTTHSSLSPLLRSSTVHLPSPLKTSPPLSDILGPSDPPMPLKVSRAFYNSFYALRLNVQIKDQPMELNLSGEYPRLSCGYLTCSTAFQPIFNKLQHLLKDFGISCMLRCFSDPLPLIELAVEGTEEIRSLLLNRDTIASYLWVIICNEFISASKDTGIGLLKGEEDRDPSAVRFQLTYRPGNTCSLDLYLISPNSQQREVYIHQVTLANLAQANNMMMSSLVFDFSSAMPSHLNHAPYKSTLQENVSLADLKEELGEVTNWFHMGIYLNFKTSSLMNMLFNYRDLGDCRSQFLSQWYGQQASALGDNTLTWKQIVAILIAVCRKSIADVIVRKYGLDVHHYYEMLKKSGQVDPAAQISLLTTSEVATLITEMKDKDNQMLEKAKPLRAYELQRKVLELSINEVFKSLNANIEKVKEKSEKRNELKQNLNKITEEFKALEGAIKLFDIHETTKMDEVEKQETVRLAVSNQKLTLANQQKLLCDILEEKRRKSQSLQKNIATLNLEIKGITYEITQLRDSLTKEHQLLLSKCQQIHQIKGITGLLQAKINACGMKLDQVLQQKVAANSVFKSSVFQLHVDILTQEAKEKESQLTLYSAREKRAHKMACETQNKLEEMDMNEQTGEMIMQGAKGEEDEDKRLMEWLKPVVESVELRNKLLKAKLSHWNNERSRRITSAEGKALTQMLNALKEISVDCQDQPEVQVEETDSEQTPSIECVLKPNQNYKAVKVNTCIKFVVELDQVVKLNVKKFTYRVDVKSIANSSIASVDFKSDISVTPNTMTFNFRPSIRGRHQVFITCNNKPLKGVGTYLFKAKQSPSFLGYPVRVIDELNYPYNVCSIPNSQVLLVSESKGRRVLFIDKGSGKKILDMNTSGMKIPNGIVVSEEGIICVVDSGNHCICLFTQQGVPLGKLGAKGDAYSEFLFPYGIKISPFDKSICVCDHNNDRIQIFSNDMKFERAVYAVSPYDVDYDSKKCMYVTDRRNHLIAVFNEKDQCIHSISGKGSEAGKLYEPRGIVIDEQDFIYVVEEGNCRVSVFDNLGQFVTSFGSEGAQSGKFLAPQGICIDEDGYLYVCDMLNNRIQVF